MKRLFIMCMAIAILTAANAQNDTIFVHFQYSTFNSSGLYEKLENDPNPELLYPFNGGAYYRYSIEADSFHKEFRFHFLSWAIDGPWPYFDFMKIDVEQIKSIDFKDNSWFQNHTFDEIVEAFTEEDPVIYIFDESNTNVGSIFLTRVLFTFTTEE